MDVISKIDLAVYYSLLLYALSSSISIAVANIAISLAAVLAIVRYYKEPITVNFDKGLLRAIAVFLVALLLSAVFAYKPSAGFERVWINLSRMLPLPLAIIFIKEKRQLLKVVILMGLSIFITDVYAIWQGVHGNHRAAGFSPIMSLAGYLIQMIPLLLVLGLENFFVSSKGKGYLISIALVSCVALVYNSTRGAWLAVLLTIILYSLMHIHIKYNKKKMIAFFVVFLLAGMVGFNTPIIKNKVNSITDMTNQSNSERILLWESSWKMFLDYPIIGVGAGNFVEVYKPHYISPDAKEPNLGHAHSNFFQMLAETGIIGITAFIYMFGYIIVTMHRRYQLNHKEIWALSAFLVTISLLFQGLTEYNFGNSAVIRMYWFILGLCYSGLHMNSDYSNQ